MTKPKFTFDFDAAKHISRVQMSENHAAEVLLMAAKYLREYNAVPTNIAEYLADAIEASMVKGEGHRAKALIEELGLKVRNRRPSATWFEVGSAVSRLKKDGMSESAALNSVAEELNIDRNTVAKYLAQDKLKMTRVLEEIKKDPILSDRMDQVLMALEKDPTLFG